MKKWAYYNEINQYAAKWVRELMAAGKIMEGEVDERSIAEVRAEDVRGFVRCHWFAGIAGWEYALQLAGWRTDKPVWTGSCPCQPLSVAGLGKGAEDERHVWPEFARLICECGPATVFGEQVASALGRQWLAGIRLDLEAMGYAVGAADLCAASVGAPHIRSRLFWVAYTESAGRKTLRGNKVGIGKQAGIHAALPGVDGRLAQSEPMRQQGRIGAELQGFPEREHQPACGRGGSTGGVDNSASARCQPEGQRAKSEARNNTWLRGLEQGRATGGVADAETERQVRQRRPEEKEPQRWVHESGRKGDRLAFWSNSVLIPCADGKWRRVPGRVADNESNGLQSGCERQGGICEQVQDSRFRNSTSANGEAIDQNGKTVEIEPALFPLADGLPGRVGILRGAGNAIVPQVAAEFVKAFMSCAQ